MARYRKLPVEIDAIQHNGDPMDVLHWIEDNGWECVLHIYHKEIHIETLEGTMCCAPGWSLIRGVQGEYYPCDPDVFAQTYEAA